MSLPLAVTAFWLTRWLAGPWWACLLAALAALASVWSAEACLKLNKLLEALAEFAEEPERFVTLWRNPEADDTFEHDG